MTAFEALDSKPKVFCPTFETIPIIVLLLIYLLFLSNLLLSNNVLYNSKTSRLSIAIHVNVIPIILFILSIYFLSYFLLITFAASEAACKVMLVAGYAKPIPFSYLLFLLFKGKQSIWIYTRIWIFCLKTFKTSIPRCKV